MRVYTLAVWGTLHSSQGWMDWYRLMVDTSRLLGSPLTHFGIKGQGLGTTNIRSIDKFLKVEAAIESSKVDWLSGYSLPKDFQTAVFDYKVHMNLCSSYVSLSAKESFAKLILNEPDEWKRRLTTFCSFRKGLLFQMDESESPLLYVSGSSTQESFRSIAILKEFN